eukprot:14556946-Alexandrium_andersonii.AAC.1
MLSVSIGSRSRSRQHSTPAAAHAPRPDERSEGTVADGAAIVLQRALLAMTQSDSAPDPTNLSRS